MDSWEQLGNDITFSGRRKKSPNAGVPCNRSQARMCHYVGVGCARGDYVFAVDLRGYSNLSLPSWCYGKAVGRSHIALVRWVKGLLPVVLAQKSTSGKLW